MKQNSSKPIFPNTYENRVTHFLKLEKALKEKDTFKVNIQGADFQGSTVTPTEPRSKGDIFRLAKRKVLESYPAWKRNELLEMEQNKTLETEEYTRFVKDICRYVEENS